MKIGPFTFPVAVLASVLSCGGDEGTRRSASTSTASAVPPNATQRVGELPASPATQSRDFQSGGVVRNGVDRGAFNRFAVRLNLPIYWVSDKNGNHSIDPDEVASLLFYPTEGAWTQGGKFTPSFFAAERQVLLAMRSASPEGPGREESNDSGLPAGERERRKLVASDLDQGAPTLVYSDFRAANASDKEFVRRILGVSKLVDALFATQKGIVSLKDHVPPSDETSQSLFRRNWGPRCFAPLTEKNPNCSALPEKTKPTVDVYPTAYQTDDHFCGVIEKEANAKTLLTPFTVVREVDKKLVAVPYSEAYRTAMNQVSEALRGAIPFTDPAETALRAYLQAAAQSFTDNNWDPADEAWSKMNAQNSKWYLRVGPDEVYWEPCSHKAGFHLTFAKVNRDSLEWQAKLSPVQMDMEKKLAALIGPPYKARSVTFHLPDFLEIISNAGDDRAPIGGTIGQSLPNWGPVAKEGRGRTVAMVNYYRDADSIQRRRAQAESLLTRDSMASFVESSDPSLLGVILHEVTHNLGPAHEYSYKGKTGSQAFGGSLASMMEELKAQSGALYFTQFLHEKNLISADLVSQAYVSDVLWGTGQVSQGMVTGTGARKPYPQLAAIQLGILMDQRAITFEPEAMAANGKDKGAFSLHLDKFPGAIDVLMKVVGRAKALGDRKAAEEFVAKYVDGDRVPLKLIADRVLRSPRASFVYAVDL